MESSSQSGRAAVLVVLGVLWLALVAVAVRFDAAFDLARGVRGLVFVALVLPLAGVWRARPARGAWPSRAVGGSALVACGLLALSLAFVPDSGVRVRRVFAPWSAAPAGVANFRLVVPTGDLAAARGEPLTLTAYLERTDPAGDLPNLATVTLTPLGGGAATTVPVPADDTAAFAYTVPAVAESFRYRFTVGGTESVAATVTAVEPTVLLPTSTLTLAPPDYAAATVPTPSLAGFPPAASALQFSRATLTLHLTGPADAVTATWTPDGGAAMPVTEKPWAVTSAGRLTVRLNGVAVHETHIAVDVDTPPIWRPLAGWPTGRYTARPGDSLPLDVRVADDVAVASVALEVRRNNDPAVRSLPLHPAGLGTQNLNTVVAVPVPPEFVNGDVMHARLVAADSRRDPAVNPTPQATAFPADGWATFTIAADPPPLAEQLAVQQRDELRRLLGRIDTHVTKATERLTAVAEAGPFVDDQRVPLKAAAEEFREATAGADGLAQTLRVGGPFDRLRPTAARLTHELNAAHAGLAGLLRELKPTTERVRQHLADALARAGSARHTVMVVLAQADGATDRRLAAEGLRRLVGVARSIDPTRPAAEVRARLDTVSTELSGAISTSPALRFAAAERRRADARAFAADLAALRQEWHALDRSVQAASAEVHRERLRETTARLAELTARLAALRQHSAGATRAFALPLPAENGLKAARADLAGGRGVDALTALEKAAGAWDRVAARCEEVSEARREPAEAIRQLERVQADLARQFADGPVTDPTRARLKFLQDELVDLAGQVAWPGEVPREPREAVAAVKVDLASPAYDRARRSLNAWADATPTLAARRADAATAVAALRATAEAWSRNPAQATASGLAAFRQQLVGFDTADEPILAARRDRLDRLLQTVEADRALGRPGDVAAGLTELRRHLDDFADALAGKIPADIRAAEIALRQRLLADAPPDDAAEQQRAVTQALGELRSRAPAGLLADAAEASRKLEAAWKSSTPPDPASLGSAVALIRRLALRLEGAESDAARWQRLRAGWERPDGFQKVSPADEVRRLDELKGEITATRAGGTVRLKDQLLTRVTQARAVLDRGQPAGPLLDAVGEALNQLGAAASTDGDLGNVPSPAGPRPPGPAERRVMLDSGGLWPEAGQAAAMRRLADAIRTLARQTSEALAGSGRWPTPLSGELAEQTRRLCELKSRLDELTMRAAAGDRTGSALRAAQGAAGRAAGGAAAGRGAETVADLRATGAHLWRAQFWSASSGAGELDTDAVAVGRALTVAERAVADARREPTPGNVKAVASGLEAVAVSLTPGPVGPPLTGR